MLLKGSAAMKMARAAVALGTAFALVWTTAGVGTALSVEQADPQESSASAPAADGANGAPGEPGDLETKSSDALLDEGRVQLEDPVKEADERSAQPDAAAVPSSNEVTATPPHSEDGERGAASPVERVGSSVFANGTPILIKNDADGKAYVFDAAGAVKLDEASLPSNPKVYGGGNGVDIAGDASVAVDGVPNVTVYGGGCNGAVSGNVTVSVNNASTGTLYGGSYSDGTRAADVGGDVTVRLTGSGTKSGVHGGGCAEATKGDASADVAGRVTLACDNFNHQAGSAAYGGGYARTSGDFSASARVGGVLLTGGGPTYVVRGGGSASASGSGAAHADVLGAIEISLTDPDVREVYSGGSASGAMATACAASVKASVTGGEMMMLYGGGTASGGVADVAGKVDILIDGCDHLYGYTLGGGEASSGGSADVGSVALSIRDSIGPVEDQWGSWVAQAVYVGGSASGAGSHANVTGAATLDMQGGQMAGNLYGGGDASGGASATVGSLSAQLADVAGYNFMDGTTQLTGLLSLYAAGETAEDGLSASLVQGPVDVSVSGMDIENVWGAVSTAGEPTAPAAPVTVRFLDGAAITFGLACVDRIELTEPLVLPNYLPKATGMPTIVSASGIAVGDAVVTCRGTDADASWFKLEDRDLAFEQGPDSASWRMTVASGAIVVEPPEGEAMPGVTIDNADSVLGSLLTDEDKAALGSGVSVVFSLSVAPCEPASEEEAVLMEAAEAGSYSFAQHLDISCAKVVGGVPTPLSQLPVALRLVIAVPDEHRIDDGTRTFAVIRAHANADGSLEATVLEDLDDDPNTVTVESDRYSTYSLVYHDTFGGGSLGPDEEGGDTPNPNPNPNPNPDPGPGPNTGPDSGPPPNGDDGSRGLKDNDGPRYLFATSNSAKPMKTLTLMLKTGDPASALVLAAGGSAAAAALACCAIAVHRRRRA